MRDRFILGYFAVALIVFGGVAIAAYQQFRQFDAESEAIHRAERVVGALDRLMASLREAESGQRGYLLTGDRQLLEPYRRAEAELVERLDHVERTIPPTEAQRRRARVLRERLEDRFATIRRGIDAHAAAGTVPDAEAFRIEQAQTLAIRGVVLEMVNDETRRLDGEIERAELTAWRTSTLLVVGNGIAFALLCTGTLLLGRELNRRRYREDKRRLDRERERLLLQSAALESRLEAVLDEMPIGVLLLDAPSGAITFQNQALRDLVGRRIGNGDDALGLLRPDGTPFPPEEHPLARARAHDEVVRGVEAQVMRPEGTRKSVVLHVGPFRDQAGATVGIVATLDDFDDRKRAEEQQRVNERFRSLFLRAVGHDLRNPLSVMTAGARTLALRATDDATAKVAARMTSSSERMARMIDQLLALAETHLGGAMALEREPMNLGEIVERAIERLEVAFPNREIRVTMSGDLRGSYDSSRLEHLVLELLANAIEHGRADTPVEVDVRGDDGEVRIDVRNRGDGIPTETMPYLFDPFRRAAARTRLKSSGFGIGLFLALQIARRHGGDLEVRSTATEGVVFRAHVPRGAS